jgi:hypothetical protein
MAKTNTYTGRYDLATAPRTVQVVETLVRECPCGENHHRRDCEAINGAMHTVYFCHNCNRPVVGLLWSEESAKSEASFDSRYARSEARREAKATKRRVDALLSGKVAK